MDWNMRPRRITDIEISELADGWVIYQSARDRLHHLNLTAIVVFELCDGTLRTAEIPPLVADLFQLGTPPVEDVAKFLSQLLAEGLIN